MQNQTNKGNFFQLLTLSQVSIKSLLLLVCLMLLTTTLGNLQPIFLGKVVDVLSMQNPKGMLSIIVGMGLVFGLLLVTAIIKDRLAAQLATQSENRIREQIVSSLLSLGNKMDKGNLSVYLEEDAKVLSTLLFQHLDIVSDLFSMVITLLFMVWIEVRLTLLIILLLPLQLLCFVYFGRLLARREGEVKVNKEHYLSHALESLVGRNNFFVFNRKSERLEEFSELSRRFGHSKFQYFMAQSIQGSLLQCLFFVYNMLLLIGGAYFIQLGELTVGLFFTYMTYSNHLLSSSFSLAEWNAAYQTMQLSLKRLQECFGHEDIIPQQEDSLESIREFETKNLAYSTSGKQILRNLSIRFRKGALYIVQSPSGRGKTTLFNLLSGFIQPDRGGCLINSKLESALPSHRVAYMLQDNYLFSLSIFENLRFYNPNLRLVDVKKTCQLLGIDDWIEELENGYDTIISAEEVCLSGGQVQVLCLARTLLRQADVYLLDEPLSKIDKDRKLHILRYLKELSQRSIVIMNSHDEVTLEGNIKFVEIE